MAIKLKRGTETTIPTLQAGEPGFTTDSKKLFVGSDAGNIEIGGAMEHLVPISWADLKALRDASLLTPGQQYRITNYTCTTAQLNTQSAGHLFDIVVTADSANKLNENTRAVQHEGDTYFAYSKLESWQLKYCIDNDTNRFIWADSVNGKGVIYRMIDEWNNDCPYDFKNIMFKRKLTDGVYDPVSGVNTWVYTFTISDLSTDEVVDISLKQNTEYMDDNGQYEQCAKNVIKEAVLDSDPDGLIRVKLNDNVFLNIFDNLGSYLYFVCYSNTFGSDCSSNTFGSSCHSNTFGIGCHDNTFGYNCYSNTFGDSCYGYTFGNTCHSNTFGSRCTSNTFGNICLYNTFGDDCYNNTFGNSCSYNTFDSSCNYNTFGTSCLYNTFGNGCRYLQISNVSGTGKRYIHVDNGTQGASGANRFDLYDSAILDKNYQVSFKKSASGKYLMLWANDDGTMTGKVKDSNTDPTWADIV